MATKNTENVANTIKLELPFVGNVILPALTRLYNMKGAPLSFKLAIKKLKEEVDAKRFDALTDIRQVQDLLKIATKKEDIVDLNARLETQYNNAAKKTIEISGKLPWSIFPDEEKVLMQHWYENTTNPETGQPLTLQGDYVTEVANIYDHLIDPDK